MQAPDTFWHFSATGWTAIGSLATALSVIVLVAFNWRFIRLARKQADASIDQARIAKESLDKLNEQINSDLAIQRHTAGAVLSDVINQIMYWSVHFRSELRAEQNLIHLIPDNWNVLVVYISHHIPDLTAKINAATIGLRNVEGEVNRLTLIPEQHRRPNSSLRVRYDGLATNLDMVGKLIKDINEAFVRKVIPKS